jgi:hypothetical protein
MWSECEVNVKWMWSECEVNVKWMWSECEVNVKWMWSECEDIKSQKKSKNSNKKKCKYSSKKGRNLWEPMWEVDFGEAHKKCCRWKKRKPLYI